MSFLYSWHPATLALLSALFAAIANILARTLLKNAKSQDMLGISFSMMAVTLIVISPFFYAFTMNPLSVGLIITIVLIDLIANYYYFKIFSNHSKLIRN